MNAASPRPQINTLVDKLSLRDRISAEEVAALEGLLGPLREVRGGADIVQRHAHPTHSTLLVSGFAGRYVTLEDGGRQISEINVAGDFVDLHSLLMRQMDHGVVALTECVVAATPHAKLIALTESHPHLTRLLWLDTLVDAAIHRQWLAVIGRRSGLGGLAHLVCELYLRLEVVGLAGQMRYSLPLTQAMLGDMLGLSTVHVNRLVSELRSEALVNWTGGQILILDWDRLAEIAEFDPTYLRLQREPV